MRKKEESKKIQHAKEHENLEKKHEAEEKALHVKHKEHYKSEKDDNKVTVAKGVKVSRGKEEKMREKPGSSNTGKYKDVSPKKFAGAAGGASKYSFPIPDLAHARNALARAHFAPDPAALKAKVYKMYPELKKRAVKRQKKED